MKWLILGSELLDGAAFSDAEFLPNAGQVCYATIANKSVTIFVDICSSFLIYIWNSCPILQKSPNCETLVLTFDAPRRHPLSLSSPPLDLPPVSVLGAVRQVKKVRETTRTDQELRTSNQTAV